jgi:glycerophosphoryl diester phosphodiesterase
MSRATDLRLYGHRGSSARLPENTISAFERALADGATALELDLHRTRDGHLVVAHDPDLRRTALRADRIAERTLAELRRYDVGAGFEAEAHHAIPTLDEVLERFPEVPLSVDIKPEDPRAVSDIHGLLRRRDAAPRVTVGSFHDRLVRALRRMGYPGPTALTRTEVAAVRLLPAVLARRWVHGQAAQIPRDFRGIPLDGRRFIARCARLGLRVDYWVINDPEDARLLMARGADGIMTDDPARIAPVLRAFEDCHGQE